MATLTPAQLAIANRLAQVNLGVAMVSVTPVSPVTTTMTPPAVMDSVLILRSNQVASYTMIAVKADDLASVTTALDLLASYTIASLSHDNIAVVENLTGRDSQAIAEGLGWTRLEAYQAWIPGPYSKIKFLKANQVIPNRVQLQWWSFNALETSLFDLTPDVTAVNSPRKSVVVITPSDYGFLPQDAGVANYLLLGLLPNNYTAVLAALSALNQYSSIIRWDSSGLIIARLDQAFDITEMTTTVNIIATQLGYNIVGLDDFELAADEADLVDLAATNQIILLRPGPTAVRVLGPEPIIAGPVAIIWTTLPVQGRLGQLIR